MADLATHLLGRSSRSDDSQHVHQISNCGDAVLPVWFVHAHAVAADVNASGVEGVEWTPFRESYNAGSLEVANVNDTISELLE